MDSLPLSCMRVAGFVACRARPCITPGVMDDKFLVESCRYC